MDDHHFDKAIKKHVGEYEVAGFDEYALQTFRTQYEAVTSASWFEKFGQAMIIGSALLLGSIIICLVVWQTSLQRTPIKDNGVNVIVSEMKRELAILRKQTPDTVVIYVRSNEDTKLIKALISKIAELETLIKKQDFVLPSTNTDLTEVSGIPFNTNKEMESTAGLNRILPRTQQRQSARADMATATPNHVSIKKMSATTLRDLEKHYRRGIGVRIGPTASVSSARLEFGNGEIGFSGGLLADLVISPSFSIESGVTFSHQFYEVPKKDIHPSMPGLDTSLGDVNLLDVDSWIWEMPLQLKYRYPLSMKNFYSGAVGISPRLYARQVLEYEYAMDNNPEATINSEFEYQNATFYPGTVNFMVGFGHELKNKKTLETSLFYQLGVGRTGVEKNKGNFLGIRTAYWFRMR